MKHFLADIMMKSENPDLFEYILYKKLHGKKSTVKKEEGVPPLTFTSSGFPLTSYEIYGNTVQNGTPTPESPVDVYGVGDSDGQGDYKIPILCGGVTTPIYLGQTQTLRKIKKLVLTGEENFGRQNISDADPTFARFSIIFKFGSVTSTIAILYASTHFTGLKSFKTTSSTAENCFEMRFVSGTTTMMIVTNAATTATSFNEWLSAQYAAGTPVTIWYVLSEPTTGIVNEPLMKIGDYADTLYSTSTGITIPTSQGINTFDVDTTVTPSKVILYHT